MAKKQKEFPKNVRSYFNPESDAQFRQKHPVGYVVLVSCGIGVLVLPLILFILVTDVWFPSPDSGFLVLGMIGCFIVGIGLFNIVAAFIGQYLGHFVTAGAFILGGALLSVCLIIVYSPDLYMFFDEEMVSYYFATMLFMALPPIFYLIFRMSVDGWLRRKGISKSKIKKLKKGRKNYWWYETLHEQFGLGAIYHLNKLITIFYPAGLILSVTLGWLRFMVPVVTGIYAVVSVLSAVMSLFSSVQTNLDAYGTPVVILRRTQNQGYTSSVFDLFIALFPLAAAHANILMMLDALHIAQP